MIFTSGDSHTSPLNTQLFAPAEFSGHTTDGHWGTSKIFNKKWGGPLILGNDPVDKIMTYIHVHKLALVNEDRDYEDGTEIAFIRGPGEDGAHLIEPESGHGTKVLFCYEPEKGETHMALFRPNESGKPKERWEIKEYSDGYYVIFNQKTGQLLYCDDAKDGRGNHKVWVGSNYLDDDSGLWEIQRIVKSDS